MNDRFWVLAQDDHDGAFFLVGSSLGYLSSKEAEGAARIEKVRTYRDEYLYICPPKGMAYMYDAPP